MDLLLQVIITAVILPLLAWATAKAIACLDSKIDFIKNQNLQMSLRSANDELERAVNLSVTEVGEIFVKSLKKEGEWNDKEATKAVGMAIDRTKQIMSDAGTKVLEDAQVSIKASVLSLIETNVKEDKEGAAPVVEVK